MYNIIRSQSDRFERDAVSFTQDLIRIPSPSLDESKLSDRIETQMKDLDYDDVHRDDVGNVVGLIHGRESEPAVLLISHMDTVNPAGQADGGRSPYEPRIEQDRLYGLGASDCKGGIAAQIYAGKVLKNSYLPLKGNLIVAATVAENNGLSLGVKHLIKTTLPELGFQPTYAILGEPTNLGLYHGHDGWMEVEIHVTSSNPFTVNDATESIYKNYLSDANQIHLKHSEEKLFVSQPSYEESNGIRRSRIIANRRIHTNECVAEVVEKLKQNAVYYSKDCGSVAVDVDIRTETQKLATGQQCVVKRVVNSWETDPFHPLLDRARQSLAAADFPVKPGKWELGRLGMGTAGGALVSEFNIPTIGFGPGLETQAHSSEEYVDVKNIGKAVYGTVVILHSLIGYPVFGWTSDDI
ncbi:MAG: M20/M25/M40 family metallo-hydrolase [Candidatus Omnitrophica bacterium]|nr:M20/M25/M40 family metallo-hydrolase [Candidatus Omnitrophota bacterium]